MHPTHTLATRRLGEQKLIAQSSHTLDFLFSIIRIRDMQRIANSKMPSD